MTTTYNFFLLFSWCGSFVFCYCCCCCCCWRVFVACLFADLVISKTGIHFDMNLENQELEQHRFDFTFHSPRNLHWIFSSTLQPCHCHWNNPNSRCFVLSFWVECRSLWTLTSFHLFWMICSECQISMWFFRFCRFENSFSYERTLTHNNKHLWRSPITIIYGRKIRLCFDWKF